MFRDFKEFILQYKQSLILGFLGLFFLVCTILISFFNKQAGNPGGFEIVNLSEESESTNSAERKSKIIVDIEGAVQNPGVYELEEKSRVGALIDKAGGISENADLDYITKNINKAQILADGVKIYIPFKGETKGVQHENIGSLININTSSSSKLESLTGIGEKTAQKIIDERPYVDINDLLTKKIVSQSVFEKIKDQITVY